MNLQIRLALAEDLSKIMDLQARSLRELSKEIYSAAQIESLVKTQGVARAHSFEAGDERIYIACLGQGSAEQIIAIASLISDRSQIGGLYVDPDYARQGIASQLLVTLEATATDQNMRVLRVMSSLVAIPFYEAMGYSRLFSRMVCFEGEKVGCMEMAKALDGSNLYKELSVSLTRQLTLQFAWTVAPLVIVVTAVWMASS